MSNYRFPYLPCTLTAALFLSQGIRDKRLVEAATQNPPFRYTTVRDGATEATLAKNYPEMNEYMSVSTLILTVVRMQRMLVYLLDEL